MAVVLESPTLLQSTLACAPLGRDADASWRFILASGVLPPHAEALFREALASEVGRGEITGPQLSLRVASTIEHVATNEGRAIDPHGARARTYWDQYSVNLPRP
jgi:hypothetical protein